MVKKKVRVHLQRTKRCVNKRVFANPIHAREAAQKLEHDVMFSSRIKHYYCGIHRAYHIGHDNKVRKHAS